MHVGLPEWLQTTWALVSTFVVPIGAGVTWFLFWKYYLHPGKKMQIQANAVLSKMQDQLEPTIVKVNETLGRVSNLVAQAEKINLAETSKSLLSELKNVATHLSGIEAAFTRPLGAATLNGAAKAAAPTHAAADPK